MHTLVDPQPCLLLQPVYAAMGDEGTCYRGVQTEQIDDERLRAVYARRAGIIGSSRFQAMVERRCGV